MWIYPSDSGRMWLENWLMELPEPLQITSAVWHGQTTGTAILPHVLTLHMMYHFTVILLNQADKRWGTGHEQGIARDRCSRAA